MSARNALGAFVLAALVVVAGTAAVGLFAGPTGDTSAAPEAPAYESSALLPEPVPEDGAVEAPAGEKTVVIDTSHGNAVPPSEMQPLVNALVRAGHDVETTGSGGSLALATGSEGGLNETLRSADAYLVANPTAAFSDAEVHGVSAFAEAGGRVVMLGDPPSSITTSSSLLGLTGTTAGSASGQPTVLARAFGVTFDSGYLYDMEENANNFQGVYAAGSGTVGEGVERAVLRDAAALVTDEATPTLTVESANLSSTRAGGDYTVAARSGNAVVIGDTDFLAPERATGADNDRLASNLAAFLVNGEKEPGAPAEPEPESEEPTYPGEPTTTTVA
jgi:hypothetical protein